jgi:hypothetical protein
LEGEGAVHAPGSKAARPFTVEVKDEAGKPVRGAAVTFHLPEDGPGGLFPSGIRTTVVTTDSQGRAAIRGMRFNRTPGAFQIRVFASKEQARAGLVSRQYIAEPGSTVARPGRWRKWAVAAAIGAGGAVAGILAARSSNGAAAPPSTSIGQPSIVVVRP